MTDRYRVVGNVRPLAGPGFATPTFQLGTTNMLWAQDIARDDTIVRFLNVEQPVADHQLLEVGVERLTKEPAVYVFHGSQSLLVDTRVGLLEPLREEFYALAQHPYLQRTIGQFIGDQGLLELSNGHIADLRAKRRDRQYQMEDSTFIRRAFDEDVVRSVAAGANTFVQGRRGSGKTALLRWLYHDLNRRGRTALFIHWAGSPEAVLHRAITSFDDPRWQDARRNLKSFHGTEAVRPSSAATAGQLRDFAHFMKRANKPLTLFIDDFGIPSADGPLFKAIIEAAKLHALQLVAALGVPPATLGDLEMGWDVQRFEIPDWSSSDIQMLLSRGGGYPSNDLEDLDRRQLAQQLQGFSPREIGDIVRRYSPDSTSPEANLRSAVSDRCDSLIFSTDVSHRLIADVLDLVASQNGRGLSDYQIQSEFSGSLDDLDHAVAMLLNLGILRSHNSQLYFFHRFVRDWWSQRSA